MKKLIYLIVLTLILGLVLTGCLLSNVGQVPTSEQSGITYLTKTVQLPDPGLVGLWRFNGDANDSSENGLNGALSPSGASFVVDGFEQALTVDGNGWVQVPDSILLEPSEITVEAWVKRLGSPGGAKYIVSKYLPDRHGGYSSYGLYTGSGGLRFYIGYGNNWIGSPQASVSAVWDGNWHRVAGTFDGDHIKLYLDGVQVDGATSTIQEIYYYDGISDLFIGSYYNGSWLAFSGRIDEVRIWSSALTADQLNDMTPPVITIITPVHDETYLLNQTVNADWNAWDGTGTGVASESGTFPSGDPIDTSTVGEKTFEVTTIDYAKNEATETVTYYVNYVFSGILPPIKPDGSSVFKLGRTIPVKFQLWDDQDNFVTDAVANIFVKKINGATSGEEMEIVYTAAATNGNLFRYDSSSNQYIFNLSTKLPLNNGVSWSAGTWEIRIELDDGISYYEQIVLRL